MASHNCLATRLAWLSHHQVIAKSYLQPTLALFIFLSTMLRLHRPTLMMSIVAAFALITLYLSSGALKEQVNLIDVISEAGIALMAGIWFVMVLSSRPAGRVTQFLALGLLGIMLGALADCCDEFVRIAKDASWNHWLEGGLTLSGMVSLTLGLYFWRIEQWQVNLDRQKRERLFRHHQGLDSVTQLADAQYLRQQIALCHATPDFHGALLMLNINDFHQINRQYSHAEGDRVLLALSHLLLLNLRPDDLLCRYAGDCFVVLQPHISLAQAQRSAEELCIAVRSLRHHPQHCHDKHAAPAALALSIRYAVGNLVASADATQDEALLQQLSRQLENAKMAVNTQQVFTAVAL